MNGTEATPVRTVEGDTADVINRCRREPSWATFSECQTYRYALGRKWADGPAALWVMLNPSTADASVDDATIRRIRGFSECWGFGSLVVANLFAFRTAYPAELATARDKGVDVVGPDNDDALRTLLRGMERSGIVVFAWGNSFGKLGWFKSRIAAVRNVVKTAGAVRGIVKEAGFVPHCLGVTGSGEPKHPVRLPGNTPLTEWKGYQ